MIASDPQSYCIDHLSSIGVDALTQYWDSQFLSDEQISSYIKENNGKCEVYPAPFAVFLNKDDLTYVEPDVSVICDPSKLNDKGCNGAPDWIIEIVSPSSKRMDYLTKLLKYRTAGVREYWIVNPMQKQISTYFFGEQENADQYSFDDDVPVGIYPGFTINIGELLK